MDQAAASTGLGLDEFMAYLASSCSTASLAVEIAELLALRSGSAEHVGQYRLAS